MELYEYKCLASELSVKTVLRKVEEHEKDGWALQQFQPTLAMLFGCGGTMGMRAIMRRPRVQGTDPSNES